MSSRCFGLVVCLLANVQGFCQDRVVVEGGAIYLELANRQRVLITTEPFLKETAMSEDGKRLAILRGAHPSELELVIMRISEMGGQLEWLIKGPLQCKEYKLPFEGTMQWSPDGKRLYMMAEFSATSAYLVVVEPETRQSRCLVPIVGYAVVAATTCRYSGYVIGLLRKHKVLHPYYWYWLLDPEGKEVEPIGEENDLLEFSDTCGIRLYAPTVGPRPRK